MGFSWDYSAKLTVDLKNSYVGFQEKIDTPPLKPTKIKPSFRKLNTPAKLHMVHL